MSLAWALWLQDECHGLCMQAYWAQEAVACICISRWSFPTLLAYRQSHSCMARVTQPSLQLAVQLADMHLHPHHPVAPQKGLPAQVDVTAQSCMAGCRHELESTSSTLQTVQAQADRRQQDCQALEAERTRCEADLRELESLLRDSERVCSPPCHSAGPISRARQAVIRMWAAAMASAAAGHQLARLVPVCS